MLSLLMLTSNLAYAQSNSVVLRSRWLNYGERDTIGSPAVFRHNPEPGVNALFVFFETQLAPESTACPAGEWGIGAAYTFDGSSWTLIGFPLISPTSGTYYSCVAAHPTIVPLADGDSWVIYFKAEQDEGSVPATADWGTDRYTGLGRFVLSYSGGPGGGNYNYTYTLPDDDPVLQSVAQDMGYPSVVFADGEYHMAFAQNPDVYVASSPFTTDFSVPAAPSLTANSSASGWDRDELFSPSLLCDGPSSFYLAVGGRVWDPYPTLGGQSVGVYSSSDLSTWTEEPGLLHDLDADDFEVKHLEVTTAGSLTSTGLFYTRPNNPQTRNDLWLSTTAGWSFDTVDTKRCP